MQQSRNQTVDGDAGRGSRRAAAMWVRHRLFFPDLCRCILSGYTSTYPSYCCCCCCFSGPQMQMDADRLVLLHGWMSKKPVGSAIVGR